MSEQVKTNAKTKNISENDKKNAEDWKLKQAEKKKLKETQGDAESKEEKKKKKEKAPKDEEKTETSKPEANTTKKELPSEKQCEKVIDKKFKKLETIETLLIPKYPHLIENRSSQLELIQKEIHNLIRPRDTILYLGKSELTHSDRLSPGSGRSNYQLVEIPEFYTHPDSEIVCRYQDISFLISEKIDKVFIEAETIFQNGSALVRKGFENIALLSKHYNKPLVITTGSWNYNKQYINNYNQLENIYGQEFLRKYDWVDCESISLVALEFGTVLPEQVSFHVEQGYRNYGIGQVEW